MGTHGGRRELGTRLWISSKRHAKTNRRLKGGGPAVVCGGSRFGIPTALLDILPTSHPRRDSKTGDLEGSQSFLVLQRNGGTPHDRCSIRRAGAPQAPWSPAPRWRPHRMEAANGVPVLQSASPAPESGEAFRIRRARRDRPTERCAAVVGISAPQRCAAVEGVAAPQCGAAGDEGIAAVNGIPAPQCGSAPQCCLVCNQISLVAGRIELHQRRHRGAIGNARGPSRIQSRRQIQVARTAREHVILRVIGQPGGGIKYAAPREGSCCGSRWPSAGLSPGRASAAGRPANRSATAPLATAVAMLVPLSGK